MLVTVESLAKSLGLFASYFAIYESYIGYFQPKGAEALEEELGGFYEWFFVYNQLDKYLPLEDLGIYTGSDKAKFIALLQLSVALPVVLMPRQRLYTLCLLSWYYMVAVRGHVLLQTPYVPIVLTMFGFSHVALLTHVLSGMIGGSFSSSATTTTTDESPNNVEHAKSPNKAKTGEQKTTKSVEGSKKKGNKKKKSS